VRALPPDQRDGLRYAGIGPGGVRDDRGGTGRQGRESGAAGEKLWRRAMTKEEALDLQATVNGILAQAAGERSRIGGAVNWADLRCVDVEMSLIDGRVTVTIEEASPGALELCRFVAKELARRGHDEIAVRTEW
jgi:hypothetical protein